MKIHFFSIIFLCALALNSSFNSFAQINDAIKFKIIDPNGGNDETILRMHNSATNNFDPMWDGWKIFTSNNSIPSFYSKSAEPYDLTINSFAIPLKDTVCNLVTRTRVVSGQYNLEIEFQGTFDSSIKVGIMNLVTGDKIFLDNNTILQFDVIADPINDMERFAIYFSPLSQISVSENNINVINAGAQNWNCAVFSSDDILVASQDLTGDSAQFNSLSNGDYYAVTTDEFGFKDTLSFSINIESEDPDTLPELTFAEQQADENEINLSTLTDETLQENTLFISSQSNGPRLMGNFNEAKDVTIHIYTLDGKLLSNENFSQTYTVDFELPEKSGLSPVILITFVNQQRQTLKVVY